MMLRNSCHWDVKWPPEEYIANDHVKIGNTEIQQSSNIKFLGINLDEKLSFKNHIWNRTKKAFIRLHRQHKDATVHTGTEPTGMLTHYCQEHQKQSSNHTRQSKFLAYKKSRREDVNMFYFIGCLQIQNWFKLLTVHTILSWKGPTLYYS